MILSLPLSASLRILSDTMYIWLWQTVVLKRRRICNYIPVASSACHLLQFFKCYCFVFSSRILIISVVVGDDVILTETKNDVCDSISDGRFKCRDCLIFRKRLAMRKHKKSVVATVCCVAYNVRMTYLLLFLIFKNTIILSLFPFLSFACVLCALLRLCAKSCAQIFSACFSDSPTMNVYVNITWTTECVSECVAVCRSSDLILWLSIKNHSNKLHTYSRAHA